VTFADFAEMRPGHIHLLTLRTSEPPTSAALTAAAPAWPAPGIFAADSGLSFAKLGIVHILTGYDHLLFLLALLLVPLAAKQVLAIITAFTVAHSCTLAAAVLGVATVPGAVVEPAIALSIAIVGGENLRGTSTRYRWLLAFGLGLIHGFGFAGVITELLPPGAPRLASLGLFNLGVEFGQLAVVLPLWLGQRWLARQGPGTRAVLQQVGSCVVIGVGLVWAILRSMGFGI
jgi:hydrogenase/urease accessory protein HupE